MREGWEKKKLGELCTVITKGTTPTSIGHSFIDEGINFVKIESISLDGRFLTNKFAYISEEAHISLRRSQLQEGDILFSIAGALGRTALVTNEILPANTNQALSIIRLNDETIISKEYLLSALTTGFTLEQVEKHKGGVAQQNLSLTQMKSFEIPIPPLSEQKQIVATLDIAFKQIDQAKANLEKNLNNAKELFQSKLNEVFSQKGEGWAEKKLNSFCEVKDGTHSSPKYIDEINGIPFVTQKNILESGLSFTSTKFISQIDHNDYYRRSNVAYDDILFSMIGANRGMACIVDSKKIFSIKNVGLIKANDIYQSKYLLYYLKSSIAKKYVENNSSGSAQGFIGLTKLRAFPIPFINIEIQKEIIQELDKLSKLSNNLQTHYQQKLNNLEDLKKSILQKAFSGELSYE